MLNPALMQLDLNLLKTLIVLLDDPSTTRAAGTLHVSQSAVSGQPLSATGKGFFEDDLFIRTGTGLKPTPRARQLQHTLPAVIDTLEQFFLNTVDRVSPESWTGDICITSTSELIDLFGAPLVKLINREIPFCIPVLSHWDEQSAQQLIDNVQNLGLHFYPQKLPKELYQSRLGSLNYEIICRSNHPHA